MPFVAPKKGQVAGGGGDDNGILHHPKDSDFLLYLTGEFCNKEQLEKKERQWYNRNNIFSALLKKYQVNFKYSTYPAYIYE